MKKIASLLFLFLSLILTVSSVSCTIPDDDVIIENVELVGRWQLIEIYADPGDGSGDFTAVDSDKVIDFLENGDLESNGSICSMSIEADTDSFGTYSITESTISSLDCPNVIGFTTNFEVIGNNLIISYPCIEPCQELYIKIE